MRASAAKWLQLYCYKRLVKAMCCMPGSHQALKQHRKPQITKIWLAMQKHSTMNAISAWEFHITEHISREGCKCRKKQKIKDNTFGARILGSLLPPLSPTHIVLLMFDFDLPPSRVKTSCSACGLFNLCKAFAQSCKSTGKGRHKPFNLDLKLHHSLQQQAELSCLCSQVHLQSRG